jgi:hypothetical protein
MVMEEKNYFQLKMRQAKYSAVGKLLRKIDFDDFLYRIGAKKIKHSPLAKYLKKYGAEGEVAAIIKVCDVDGHIGELPPELLKLVDKKDRSAKTKEFFMALDKLVKTKGSELSKHQQLVYRLPEICKIFDSYCVLRTAEPVKNFINEYETWGGSFGDVYKICFTEIGAEYALKIYKPLHRRGRRLWNRHGAKYEIPTAFCANKSEPKENNPVYMAKLNGCEYMLSKWQDKEEKPIPRYQNRIFETSNSERKACRENFINGIRIDYGDTYRLDYGYLSYNGRKWYRKINTENLYQIKYEYSKLKNNFEKNCFYEAMELFFLEYIRDNRLNLTHDQQSEIKELIQGKNIEIFDKYFKKSFPPICR